MMWLSLAAHNARAAGLAALVMSAGNGKLIYYAAPQPAAGDPPTGAALATQPITAAQVSDGGMDLTLATVLASATGIPTWCRIAAGDDTWILDGDMGDSVSSALVRFADGVPDPMYQGGEVVVLSARIEDG